MLPDHTPIHVSHQSDGRQALKLAGDLDVFLASQLHQTAVQLAEGKSDVTVHCDEVRMLDTSALQILVALQDALTARGRSLRMETASPETLETLRFSGLASRLAPGNSQP